MSAETSIQVGVSEDTVWIRVDGKGNFQNSPSLKDFTKEMLARGHKKFVVDLRCCPLMDSTFMGTLASIALRLHGMENAGVQVVNLNDRTRSLLSNLGLDQLLTLQPHDVAGCPDETTSLCLDPCGKTKQAEIMLEAHEAVVEANPEKNEAKFKDVLEFLRQDLQGKTE